MWHEIQIIGTVGREPELRYTADGKASCSFSLASNRKLQGGKEETIWFKVTTWEKMAEKQSGMLLCSINMNRAQLVFCTAYLLKTIMIIVLSQDMTAVSGFLVLRIAPSLMV